MYQSIRSTLRPLSTASMGLNKEGIFDWYRKLANWDRVDFMCGLLDLCHPFEIRYLGTFIEEIGRKDYAALKVRVEHFVITSKISRISTEHMETNDSSDSKLYIETICSIRILSILEVIAKLSESKIAKCSTLK